jgi:hypothetical protein
MHLLSYGNAATPSAAGFAYQLIPGCSIDKYGLHLPSRSRCSKPFSGFSASKNNCLPSLPVARILYELAQCRASTSPRLPRTSRTPKAFTSSLKTLPTARLSRSSWRSWPMSMAQSGLLLSLTLGPMSRRRTVRRAKVFYPHPSFYGNILASNISRRGHILQREISLRL